VVAQRRHHPSNTTLSRRFWPTIHAAAAAVVDDPAGRYCTEDSATSERPQRPLSMIRSRGTLSPNFDERSTANSTSAQSTPQLTYFWFLFFSSELSSAKHFTWPTWQFTISGSRDKVNRCKRTKRTPLSHLTQPDSDEAGRGECYKHPQRLKVIKHRMFSYRKRRTIKPTVTKRLLLSSIFSCLRDIGL